MTNTDFSSLGLLPELFQNLASLNYREMTPIQAQSLPAILAGKDVIAQGKTGSGKTAAFGLGILQKIKVDSLSVQALVICPTRELAQQVAGEIRHLARTLNNIKVLELCGGVPARAQIVSLEHGAHIVVGTPGRIQDHLEKKYLNLNKTCTLVLDEADRMLEMGFQDVLDEIISQVPVERQTLLFSATYPSQIQAIAKRIMLNSDNTNLLRITVDTAHDEDSIQQYFYQTKNEDDRLMAIRLLFLKHRPQSTLIFCNTKQAVQSVAEQLCKLGFSALSLHGDREQKDRDQTLIQFSNKSASILVATDVASRGLDIDSIDWVINYDLASSAEIHTHRIGRTARAGLSGVAYSFYSANEKYKLAQLELEQVKSQTLPPSSVLNEMIPKPLNRTIRIDSGKKQKIRAGDILGALTGDKGIDGKQVGKIKVFDRWSYVAINRECAKQALQKLLEGKLKGRACRAKFV